MRIFCTLFTLMLCSCATIFNGSRKYVVVHDVPRDVVIKPKTAKPDIDLWETSFWRKQDAERSFIVNTKRSFHPLRLMLYRNNNCDSTELIIKPKLSSTFFLNFLYGAPFTNLLDLATAKGFTYPGDVYLDTNAIFHHLYIHSDLYAGGNKVYHTFKRDTSSKLKLLISVTVANQYNLSTNNFQDFVNPSNTTFNYERTGGLGLSLGAEIKLNKNNAAVVNFSYNERFGSLGDYTNATEKFTNVMLGLNHTVKQFPRFSLQGGISWFTYKYNQTDVLDSLGLLYYGVDTPGYLQFSGLGLQAGLQYRLRKNTFLALNNMVGLVPLNIGYTNSSFNYFSFDVVYKPVLSRGKRR